MFESLSDKLGRALARLSGRGRISESDIDEALRAVRLALLEADVDFKVVRQFIAAVKEQAKGTEVFGSLTPGQSVIRIVHDELTKILGGETVGLQRSDVPPTVIMLVGLQGSGKTTTAAKLAVSLRREMKQDVMLAACDLRRPAAIEQLLQLGKQINVPVYQEDPGLTTTVEVARNAARSAQRENASWLIVDTGGRLHIDDEMMAELGEVRDALDPAEILLVADALTGQDAVRSGSDFHALIGLTGIIMTKMDGDARGGGALSMRSVTGVPIKYMGVGEKTDALEQYHPDRLASRILGMGDVQSLIEKAEQQIDVQQARELEKKLRKAQFDLNDFLDQLRSVRKMGPASEILGMIPGLSALRGRLDPSALDDRRLSRVEAIVLSMTPSERRNPKTINGSRRKRIAIGSGVTPTEVNQLLNQFRQMQKLMRRFTLGGNRQDLMRTLAGRG